MTGAVMTPWEVSVIRRIDDAVLPLLNRSGGKKLEESKSSEDVKDDLKKLGKGRIVVKRQKVEDG